MSGMMFIDDSRSDGRQFCVGRVCQLWQRTALAALPCQFLPSATPISVLLPLRQGQSLDDSWHRRCQAPGLLWVIATPDRVAWWHGDCAIAGVADGYRNRAERYEGITMKTLMIVRPGMIAATAGVKDLHKVALNAAGALKGALCGS
jgi:hypothetical protein